MGDLVASRSPYVDGAFVAGDARSFTVVDPATEAPAAEVEASSVVQVDDAIAITNDSEYDLSAGIYTSDLARATEIVPRIRTGTVQVNTGAANAFTPMGGHKHSGIGRERGVPGIRAFQQVKHVVIGNG